jgi:hypothetical protein
VDFKASFSNLNYWPQHEKLNRANATSRGAHSQQGQGLLACFHHHWRNFRQGWQGCWQLLSWSVSSLLFALFEDFSGKFEVFAWLLQNDVSELSFAQCEVSLLLIEKATRMRILTPDVLARVLPSSITRHVGELRRYDTYLGIR